LTRRCVCICWQDIINICTSLFIAWNVLFFHLGLKTWDSTDHQWEEVCLSLSTQVSLMAGHYPCTSNHNSRENISNLNAYLLPSFSKTPISRHHVSSHDSVQIKLDWWCIIGSSAKHWSKHDRNTVLILWKLIL
jgi:hypothetical protein